MQLSSGMIRYGGFVDGDPVITGRVLKLSTAVPWKQVVTTRNDADP